MKGIIRESAITMAHGMIESRAEDLAMANWTELTGKKGWSVEFSKYYRKSRDTWLRYGRQNIEEFATTDEIDDEITAYWNY